MIDYVDDFLNGITMYRLVLYALSALAAVPFAYGLFGLSTTSFWALVASFTILMTVCYIANTVFARLWRAVQNFESGIITTLILFLILPPVTSTRTAITAAIAGLVAIASKFIIARYNRHIFNPAAFGAVVVGAVGLGHATWWIGSSQFWPYELILGLLIIRKIRRFSLLIIFVITSLVVAAIVALQNQQDVLAMLKPALIASPLIFLGTVMLPEPATIPSRNYNILLYGVLVGVFYAAHPSFGPVYVYPEIALLIGNLFAYVVEPRRTVNLALKEIQQMSERVYSYMFVPEQKLAYAPGQYMEWTLPNVPFDARGNRRTFTIASSPTEGEVMLGVKFYEPASAYKTELASLKPGARMVASQVAGNFILPKNPAKKLLLIAGGIGITPFRSMLQYLIDTDEKRDIVLFYLVSDPEEISFQDVLQQALDHGIHITPVVTSEKSYPKWQGLRGPFDTEMLKKYVADLSERTVYISGPNGMVTSTQRLLQSAGVPRSRIKTDHFSGY